MKTSRTIGILIILIFLGIIVYAASRSQPTSQNTVENSNATTTPSTATSTPESGSISNENPNLRNYANATLGISFTYPKDFIVRREGFSTSTGEWYLDLYEGGRGDIIVTAGKNLRKASVRLNATPVKIGSKDGTMYDTRLDTCDGTIANTRLDDANYLEFTFASCGDNATGIYKDRTAITDTIASVKFTNENSRLFVNPKLGFAFRYPIEWSQPKVTTTSTGSQVTFGQDLAITVGAQYSTGLKRNLTFDEVVTGAMTTATTTTQNLSVGGKPATLLTTTPRSGATQRAIYMQNKSTTDMIIIKQTAVDSQGIDLVAGSFGFIQ